MGAEAAGLSALVEHACCLCSLPSSFPCSLASSLAALRAFPAFPSFQSVHRLPRNKKSNKQASRCWTLLLLSLSVPPVSNKNERPQKSQKGRDCKRPSVLQPTCQVSVANHETSKFSFTVILAHLPPHAPLFTFLTSRVLCGQCVCVSVCLCVCLGRMKMAQGQRREKK